METLSHAGGADELVVLDPDHPGFRDPEYRARRNAIARLALDYVENDLAPHVHYTDLEHAVWQQVWSRLGPLHDELACTQYRQWFQLVPMDRARIPQLEEINSLLGHATGFRMLPVAGLVSARAFLSYLSRGIFLATQYIRHWSRPLYTPEPDVVHELVGHAATLADPRLAELNRLFGRATDRSNEATVERIGRVYWHTLEFGAIWEKSRPKAFGAGLLSSAGELERLRGPHRLRKFNVESMAGMPYDPTDYQPAYFVAESFDDMIELLSAWLRAL